MPGGSGPVRPRPMEGHAGAPWRHRAVARRRGAGGLLRRLLPGEHAARGGASGRLPRHPRRARTLRPRGEAARESAAARVSSPAPLRPEGAQAALGSGRPAAGADRDTARRRGRAVDMGPDQLGHPVVERHPGGRRAGAPLPSAPVVHVDAPGSIETYKGHELVGKLQGGRLSGSRVDLFQSEWLPGQFSGFLEELAQRHEAARNRARELSGAGWAPLDPTLPLRIAERMMKRVISVLRDARHGGTVLFVPTRTVGEPSWEHPHIDLRYPFDDAPARRSFPNLIVDILDRLAQLYGTADQDESRAVGWREFEVTTDAEIETLDEALFETAHLIAGLAAADGAVVMSKHNELLGFGGMISGRLPDVERVWRALDLEGEEVAEEGTGNVGARHRSAYRLGGALPGSVAVVISQDGGVRFVCQRGGRVTYWEQE